MERMVEERLPAGVTCEHKRNWLGVHRGRWVSLQREQHVRKDKEEGLAYLRNHKK